MIRNEVIFQKDKFRVVKHSNRYKSSFSYTAEIDDGIDALGDKRWKKFASVSDYCEEKNDFDSLFYTIFEELTRSKDKISALEERVLRAELKDVSIVNTVTEEKDLPGHTYEECKDVNDCILHQDRNPDKAPHPDIACSDPSSCLWHNRPSPIPASKKLPTFNSDGH